MFLLVAVLILLPMSSCQILDLNENETDRLQHQELRDALLRRYPKNIPPAKLVEVSVFFAIFYIRNLDVESQIFSVFGAWSFDWNDPLLRWNSSESSVPAYLPFNADDIWTPKLLLSNNARNSGLRSEDDVIVVDNNGSISMTFMSLVETQCHVDVSRYPFDEQVCDVTLTPRFGFTYRDPRVALVTTAQLLGKSVEWQLMNCSAKLQDVPYFNVKNVVIIQFYLKREYMFYLLTVILPVCLLSVMNACVFLLPVESGEKISYLISILVTYSVFINFINEVMPKSATPSRLGIYLVLVLCQSCAAILVTLRGLRVHFDADDMTKNPEFSKTEISTENIPPQNRRKIGLSERFLFFIFVTVSLLSLLVFFL